ncbi:hypothetical protein Y032_0464g1924 [Ancylostoma ceylanicum]|uniref:Uncharacterized protein n=1 Tax=Ancylostoma ceylanicum TaxID=53326 RepID=A0A016WXE2_9BILA|nr:hypothetical protein Y032_0464g1924 [Ancylostoma ceylanicum]
MLGKATHNSVDDTKQARRDQHKRQEHENSFEEIPRGNQIYGVITFLIALSQSISLWKENPGKRVSS